MAKSVKALVKKELLVWARTTAGYRSVDEAAVAGRLTAEKLSAWEAGEDRPSVPQLRKLADLYKRPLAVFYLAEVPDGFMVLRDLRRLPGMEMRRMSPNLLLEIRRASQRRALALELMEEVGSTPPRFGLKAQLNEDPDLVGARIRSAFEVTVTVQKSWRDTRQSWNAWRSRVESLGVMVFQATRIATDEASGLAIADDVLPVVVVNRADPVTRRTFSLIHEFAHLMARISSVSDISDGHLDDPRPPEDQKVEVFCNAVAAATLMPRSDFLAHQLAARYPGCSVSWTDEHVSELAQLFGVSREAIVRRLLTFGRTTNEFYLAKREQYIKEYVQARKRQLDTSKDMKRNMAQEALSNLGAPLVSMILGNYHSERLSISEVSGYLGIKTKHIAKLEKLAGAE